MLPKRSLPFALAAAVAGVAFGYVTRRGAPRARALAALQGFEWFLSAGGAAVLTEILRRSLEDDRATEVTERVVHVDQAVFDRGSRGR